MPTNLAPRQMQMERQGELASPVSRRFPRVRGGTCDYCGVINPLVDGTKVFQYQLCPHFQGMDLQCSYCPPEKNQREVLEHADLNVREHPDKPGVLIAWCNSFDCSDAHLKRFGFNKKR